MIVVLPLLSAGQVTVSVQFPPGGMIQKEQLWNVVLMNNNKEALDVILTLDIQDAVTGQSVLSAATRNFYLNKGVKMFSFRDAQPIQYNYLTTELMAIGSFIPLGSYVACYRVIENSYEKGSPVADECVRLNITPLSPPLLNTPADKSIVESNYPQFSWFPPSPYEMFNSLSYEIAVVEVLNGQSSTEAILYNVPLYTNSNIKNPFENYPTSFSSLQPGKTYAWQVTARNGTNYAAQTEVWSFTIKAAETFKKEITNTAYIALRSKHEPAGISYINGKTLFLKYYSFDKDHEAAVRFFANDGKLVKEIKKNIVYGDNLFQIQITNEFKGNSSYSVEITDIQSNIHYAKFHIQ